MRSSLAAALALGSALAIGVAVPAYADPKPRPDVTSATLSCDNGSTYDVVVSPGGGRWTPGFDTASNMVFTPLSLGPFHMHITDASTGAVLLDETDPAVETKRAEKNGLTIVHCSFRQTGYGATSEFGVPIDYWVTGDVTAAVKQ